MNPSQIVGIVVAVLIGLSLVPTIALSVATSQANNNVTGVTDTILGLVPFLFIVMIVLATVYYVKSRK